LRQMAPLFNAPLGAP